MNRLKREILNQDFDGTECCPYCDMETDFVFNPMNSEYITCSHCGRLIRPCTLCDGSRCNDNCIENIRETLYQCNTYSWDEIYDAAIDCGYGDNELKAKDEARWEVRCFVLENKGGEDLEEVECPEDEVEFYCDKYGIRFNEYGNIVGAN